MKIHAPFTPVLLASLLTTVGIAQGDGPTFEAPERVFELDASVGVTVSGSEPFRVFLGEQDITSEARILEQATLGDGSVHYELDLSSVELGAGDSLRFRSSSADLMGEVVTETVVEIAPNVEITAFVDAEAPPTGPTVQVAWHAMNLETSMLAVFYFGNDVTSLVPMIGPISVDLIEDPSNPLAPALRVEEYRLDFSALGGATPPDGAVEIVALGMQPDASLAYAISSLAGDTVVVAEPAECVKDAVNAFLAAIGLSKDGDCTSISANEQQVKAAADALSAALNDPECVPRMSSSGERFTYTDASGDEVDVFVDYSESGSASANVSADVVIAVSGGNGGSASATNKKKCGAAVAVGGEGRGGISNPRNGGKANARSGAGGQATAVAGDGGRANPATRTGGAGGTSSATTPGGANTTNPGSSGSPGQRGGGGHSQTSGNSSSGGSRGPFGN